MRSRNDQASASNQNDRVGLGLKPMVSVFITTYESKLKPIA